MKRALLLLLPLAVTFGASAQRFQLSDRFRLTTLSDPQISVDGRQIVCVSSRPNTAENRYGTSLVLIDVADGAQQTLTADRRGVSWPRWSPDGSKLAFLANGSSEKDAKKQIWILPMRGGDARRITDAAKGVQQFAWSPDGAQLAFVSSDEPERDPALDKHNLAFEVGDDDFLTTTAATPSHLWLIPSDGGKAKRLTSGAWSLPVAHPPGPVPSPLTWSADGKTIAITRLANPHSGNTDRANVVLVDVASGSTRPLTARTEFESQPVFSPDGSKVAYWYPLGGTRANQNEIWVAASKGGDSGASATHALDRNVARAIWMPDNATLLVGARDATGVTLWLQPANGGPARRLDLGDINPTSPFWIDANVGRNGAIAFTGTTPSRPRELYYLASPDVKPRRLTDVNHDVAALDLGRTERITWTNEGLSEDGVVTYPPSFDASKKYPLVVYIHGGPRSSSTTDFSILPQLFAAHDWVVFQPNYRGSDNLGNAYLHAINSDSGAGPGRDVMAGMDALKKRGFIDAEKIVVGGWSYGGYMTSWMIGHYPIFKAAVSGAAVNNLLDAYNLSDGNVARRWAMGGSPYTSEETMKRYVEQSPITYASKIRTPTLILSDTGDYRVPITQSYQMNHALKDNGVPVKFFAYPVGGHSPDDPIHASDVDRRYVEWFEQYLK
ncbi:MAG: hypothetical protein JWO56_1330 [Acidobacteria bacterium]|nr:hypothetical protein [Acidobacteriota bacterium]